MTSLPDIEERVHWDPERGRVFTLLKPLTWCHLTVPAGFESDGASVPRFFWRLVFPPSDERAKFAAYVHDWIYRTRPAGWTRPMADDAFRDLLILGGVPAWRARLAFWGVRLGGASAWAAGGTK